MSPAPLLIDAAFDDYDAAYGFDTLLSPLPSIFAAAADA